MENNQPETLPMGPRSGRRPIALSPAQQRVLDRLRQQPVPTSLAALVRSTGLHENTLRAHLEALQRSGHLRRHRAPAVGRGRPAWLYEATQQDRAPEYAGLAAALAASIAATSPDPAAVGREAGLAWGHEIARERGAQPASTEEAREEIVVMLDDLGFGPVTAEDSPDELRLTRCPLLEAAHRNPEVVCAVHLGIVRGALDEYGADSTGTSLEPFAEPGACLLVVPPSDPDIAVSRRSNPG